jgi:hypothetical protein
VDLPDFLLQHIVPVEAYEGTNGNGEPVFAAPFDFACFADDKRRMVRDKTGAEVVSESTLYGNRGPSIPTGSRVTLPSGRVSYVITVADRDGGDLPVPSHLEIACE